MSDILGHAVVLWETDKDNPALSKFFKDNPKAFIAWQLIRWSEGDPMWHDTEIWDEKTDRNIKFQLGSDTKKDAEIKRLVKCNHNLACDYNDLLEERCTLSIENNSLKTKLILHSKEQEEMRLKTFTEVIDLQRGILIVCNSVEEKDYWYLHQKGKEPAPYSSYFLAKNAALQLKGESCTKPKS
jgi:hypothetical protein